MDKELLLKRKANLRSAEVKLDGGEVVVVVRALSRGEVEQAKKDYKKDGLENALISMALLDPKMTPEEVDEWLADAPAGDSVAVMSAVSELSGMSEEVAKRVQLESR
jgi:hypothetical protein